MSADSSGKMSDLGGGEEQVTCTLSQCMALISVLGGAVLPTDANSSCTR